MLITVLSVPECPNVAALIERVQHVSGRVIGTDAVVIVEDEQQAQAWTMPGSPTLLLNGLDPFEAGLGASLSCRLYLDANGAPAGAPDLDRLRVALADAAQMPAPADWSWLDPVSRGELGRAAPIDGGLRAVQQTVLLSIALSGAAPEPAALDRAAAPYRRRGADALSALAEQDFLSLDERGCVRAAYPFSLIETRHRVRIAGGATVWSMCAIDALGIASMLGGDTVIDSADPLTNERVQIASTARRMDWAPGGAVVFAGRRAGSGPAELLLRPDQLLRLRAQRNPLGRAPHRRRRRGARPISIGRTRTVDLRRVDNGHLSAPQFDAPARLNDRSLAARG